MDDVRKLIADRLSVHVPMKLNDFERGLLEFVLERTHGNQKATGRLLAVHRATVCKHMRRLGIPTSRPREA